MRGFHSPIKGFVRRIPVVVTDVMEREIHHQRIVNGPQPQLDLRGLPRGLYHVSVSTADHYWVRKLVLR